MKTIVFYPSTRRTGDHPNLLHVETELGIVNIWVGLTDNKGRKVETVSIISDNYAGERKVTVAPVRSIRLTQLKRKS